MQKKRIGYKAVFGILFIMYSCSVSVEKQKVLDKNLSNDFIDRFYQYRKLKNDSIRFMFTLDTTLGDPINIIRGYDEKYGMLKDYTIKKTNSKIDGGTLFYEVFTVVNYENKSAVSESFLIESKNDTMIITGYHLK